MANSASILSVRIDARLQQELDRAAKATRRSRSFLVKEALDLHLARVVNDLDAQKRTDRIGILRSIRMEARKIGGRSAAQIEADREEFRGEH